MNHALGDSARLLVTLKGKDPRHIDLQHPAFTIGRKPDNDLTIEDHTVSGHHARIIRVQSVYFLEDLKSTNGTSVNGKPIERHQLRHADLITIGQHQIVFQEPNSASASSSPQQDSDKTMIINRKHTAPSLTLTAKLLVTDGKTDRLEYAVNGPVSLIGSHEDAAIRLTGWFAPKSAAQIFQRGGAFFISPTMGAKALLVNGVTVPLQQQLKDGDQISVAGITMTFYMQARKAA